MSISNQHALLGIGLLAGIFFGQPASAAIALDRTRVIFPGNEHAISLNIHNENTQLPFLAQAWLEDSNGKKSPHRWSFYRHCSGWNPVLPVS